MVSHLPRKPIFTASQLDRLSNIFDNAGQGFFVVLVLTPLVEGIDKVNSGMLLLGAIDVLGCWIISLTLARIKDKRKRL